jgi:beta-galactosidase
VDQHGLQDLRAPSGTASPASRLPSMPYGAVYFRKSNPPPEDWERDYETAAADGANVFRHWFIWSAIEVRPGRFDWADYDRQFELAQRHGMRVVVAEMAKTPEWLVACHPECRTETRDGRRLSNEMNAASATSGRPGLCLSHPVVQDGAASFLRALAARYRDHPALGCYDVWNECNVSHSLIHTGWERRRPMHYLADVCYCPACTSRFRRWLERRYGDLDVLNQVWRTYSYSDWSEVQAPRELGPWPSTLDWLRFRTDDGIEKLRWRVATIREVDPHTPIAAHGVAGSIGYLAGGGTDDWRSASEVDIFGYTWSTPLHGREPWRQFQAVDSVRCAARGKDVWDAEATAGPIWTLTDTMEGVVSYGVPSPAQIRIERFQGFSAGANGVMHVRWRPLLDGPLFGAFGAYGLDGSRTDRAEMARRIGEWATAAAQRDVWRARPVRGDLGIVLAPETQVMVYAQRGHALDYAHAAYGAARAFFASNLQADWVRLEDIDAYPLLYLPFPLMLEPATVERLSAWVAAGGELVCEGPAAYFGPTGRAGTRQPNLGLDELFGAREVRVAFDSGRAVRHTFALGAETLHGALVRQEFEPRRGVAAGYYSEGGVAAVAHRVGRGGTLLFGTVPALRMGEVGSGADPALVRAYRQLFDRLGEQPVVTSSASEVTVRLHQGPDGLVLWATNPSERPLRVTASVADRFPSFSEVRALWGEEAEPERTGRAVTMTVGALDAAVLQLA